MPFTEQDELFLRRAWVLARRASPSDLATNPPVGAVIAKGTHILAEGWHEKYGGPHAEINALQRLTSKSGIEEATLYVTLEPCCHHGKTPPCTSAILASGLRRVVIGTMDPNPRIAGQGAAQLQEAGIEVIWAPDPKPYQNLIRPFAVSIREKRPYLTLKWAQLESPGFPPLLGSRSHPQYPISTFWGRVWGHRLRSQHTHIAVGYGTWRIDQPRLTTRLFPGDSPQPIVFYDPRRGKPEPPPQLLLLPIYPLPETLSMLYHEFQAGSLLVEGGTQTLQAFLSSGLFDEIHILTHRIKSTHLPDNPVWAPTPPLNLSFKRYRLSPGEYAYIHRRPLSW